MNEPVFTPAGQQPNPPIYELSGWWRRVGASLIDGFIIYIAALVTMVALGVDGGFSTSKSETFDIEKELSTGVSTHTTATANADFHLNGWGILIFFIYSVLLATTVMAATNGRTVGMMATGIRVVREGGEKISFGFAFYRENIIKGFLFGWLAIFTLYIATLLNYLWPLWDDKNQALHDKICKTRVVRIEAPEIDTAFTPPPPPPPPAPPAGPPAPPAPPDSYRPPSGFENPVPED